MQYEDIKTRLIELKTGGHVLQFTDGAYVKFTFNFKPGEFKDFIEFLRDE